LKTIGKVCSYGASVLSALSMGIQLHEQRLFRSQLESILKKPHLTKQERSKEALTHLKQLISVTSEEHLKICREVVDAPDFKMLSTTTEEFETKVKEKEKFLLQKKAAYLTRLTSEKCVALIQQDGDADKVIEAVQKRSLEKTVVASIGMALAIIGIVTFLLSGPIGLIATAVIGLALSVAWSLIDAHELAKEFKSTTPGRFDKLFLCISSVIATLVITALCFFSAGIVSIIVALVLGVIWLGMNAACYYRLSKLTV